VVESTEFEGVGADLLSRKITILPDVPASSAAVEEGIQAGIVA
jgi:hypothetical protein